MKIKIRLIRAGVPLALGLTGCGPRGINYNLTKPETVRSATTVERTKFDRFNKIIGPDLWVIKEGMEPITIRYFLGGLQDPETLKITHQVVAVINYSGSTWRFYQSGDLDGGERPKFVKFDSQVTGCHSGRIFSYCSYQEIIGLQLTDDLLSSRKDRGIDIRLNVQRGQSDFLRLSPNYINGYLQAVGKNEEVK